MLVGDSSDFLSMRAFGLAYCRLYRCGTAPESNRTSPYAPRHDGAVIKSGRRIPRETVAFAGSSADD